MSPANSGPGAIDAQTGGGGGGNNSPGAGYYTPTDYDLQALKQKIADILDAANFSYTQEELGVMTTAFAQNQDLWNYYNNSTNLSFNETLMNTLIWGTKTNPGYFSTYGVRGGGQGTAAGIRQWALAQEGFTPQSYELLTVKDELARKYGEEHAAAIAMLKKYFGYNEYTVDHNLVAQVEAHGKDMQQMEDYVRTLPSHLGGINIGQYTDLRALADKQSQTIYGMNSNDAIIQDLHKQGWTTQAEVNYYYRGLPFQPDTKGTGQGVDPKIYNEIYNAASANSKAIWNQEPHPMDLQQIHDSQQTPVQGAA